MSDTSLFGTRHLVFIAISFVLLAVTYLYSRKLTVKQCARILLYVGIVSEIVKIIYYTQANEGKWGGVLPKGDLPFHLCSIQILFTLVVNLTTSEKLRRFIYSFMVPSCLLGGIAAILIATSSSRSTWVITFQYFLYHVAISAFALRLLTDKEMKWRVGDMFNCFKMLLVMMFFAFYINSIVYDGVSDINFMYVASPPQPGLPFLTEKYGWLVYIAHYAFLVVLCVVLCYLKAIIDTVKDKKATIQAIEDAITDESVMENLAIDEAAYSEE